jgi:hypothetical protein
MEPFGVQCARGGGDGPSLASLASITYYRAQRGGDPSLAGHVSLVQRRAATSPRIMPAMLKTQAPDHVNCATLTRRGWMDAQHTGACQASKDNGDPDGRVPGATGANIRLM